MFLKHKSSGNVVEVMDIQALFDPFKDIIQGCFHAGEELQEASDFAKAELVFPSGESLPRCWVDAHYRDASLARG